MVALVQAEIHHLKALLKTSEYSKIDKFILTKDEEVAPKFLLKFAIDKLVTDVVNAFWWTPRLILVEQRIVGMIGFKGIPKLENDYSIEIGYGIVPSQRKNGFATEAVKLILEEAFSVSK